jgi:hypothetical protein
MLFALVRMSCIFGAPNMAENFDPAHDRTLISHYRVIEKLESRSILAKWEVHTKKCVRRNMYAETLHTHIRRRRRRSSTPSLGRKMEARHTVPSFGGKVMRF